MISIIKRNCPSCSSQSAEIELKPEIDPYANIELLPEYWRGFNEKKIFFPYCRCKCGLLYCDSYFDNKSIMSLYSSMDDNIHGDEFSDNLTREHYISFLNLSHSLSNLKILEIGADNGSFSKKILEKLDTVDIDVIEPNQNMKMVLENTFSNYYEKIEDIDSSVKYDLIIAIHVLDHVSDLNEFINKIQVLLKKGGKLMVVVHNERSLLSRVLGKRWPAYCLQHPHLFNKDSLKSVMEKHNLQSLDIKNSKNYFQIGYLLHHIFLAVFRLKVRFPSFFSIGLKLGNIMSIFIKK